MKIYVRQKEILILFEFLFSPLFYIITYSKMELIIQIIKKGIKYQGG